MPKPPPLELFDVTIRSIPKEMLGETIAANTKLGHNDIDFHLVTETVTFKNNSAARGTARDFLAVWIADHPTFKAIEAVNDFKAASGNGGSSIYPALSLMIEKGVLKKVGDGLYARTDVKALAPPKSSKPEKKSKPGKKKAHDVTHKDFVLRIARRNHGRFKVAKLKDAFDRDGRNRDSVSTAVHELEEAKQVKRVAEGEYVLLNRTKPKKETETPVTMETTNG
jgi:hypothetical protein